MQRAMARVRCKRTKNETNKQPNKQANTQKTQIDKQASEHTQATQNIKHKIMTGGGLSRSATGYINTFYSARYCQTNRTMLRMSDENGDASAVRCEDDYVNGSHRPKRHASKQASRGNAHNNPTHHPRKPKGKANGRPHSQRQPEEPRQPRNHHTAPNPNKRLP